MPTLTTIIQHSFGSFSHSNQRRKRNKRNPNRKRRRKAEWGQTMERYLASKRNKLVFVLLDIRRVPSGEDIEMLEIGRAHV